MNYITFIHSHFQSQSISLTQRMFCLIDTFYIIPPLRLTGHEAPHGLSDLCYRAPPPSMSPIDIPTSPAPPPPPYVDAAVCSPRGATIIYNTQRRSLVPHAEQVNYVSHPPGYIVRRIGYHAYQSTGTHTVMKVAVDGLMELQKKQKNILFCYGGLIGFQYCHEYVFWVFW